MGQKRLQAANSPIIPSKTEVFSCMFRLTVVIFASQSTPVLAGSNGAAKAGVSFMAASDQSVTCTEVEESR